MTCDIWDTDYNSDDWEPDFMTIFATWQLRVTLESIRNSCDVFSSPFLKRRKTGRNAVSCVRIAQVAIQLIFLKLSKTTQNFFLSPHSSAEIELFEDLRWDSSLTWWHLSGQSMWWPKSDKSCWDRKANSMVTSGGVEAYPSHGQPPVWWAA